MILTKRKIETETDRFGGFATRQSKRSYFAPMQENFSDVRAETIKEIQEFEPLPILDLSDEKNEVFEIEKEYNNFVPAVKEEDFAEKQLPTFSIPKSEIKAMPITNVRLNTRGKILITVYAVIVALLLSFVIYNAVTISAGRSSVNLVQSEFMLKQAEIDALMEQYNALVSESGINKTLNESESNLRKATENDYVKINLGQEQTRQKAKASTNWFDKLCNFFSNLF